jgi:hypothetical protein
MGGPGASLLGTWETMNLDRSFLIDLDIPIDPL